MCHGSHTQDSGKTNGNQDNFRCQAKIFIPFPKILQHQEGQRYCQHHFNSRKLGNFLNHVRRASHKNIPYKLCMWPEGEDERCMNTFHTEDTGKESRSFWNTILHLNNNVESLQTSCLTNYYLMVKEKRITSNREKKYQNQMHLNIRW